jgi:hypothetical protein
MMRTELARIGSTTKRKGKLSQPSKKPTANGTRYSRAGTTELNHI